MRFREAQLMRVVTGDLLKLAVSGEFDVIVHGCNCFCTMGAGIAKGIKSLFPDAYEADQQTEKGDRSKLGTITWATVDCLGRELTVVNAYTQYNYRGQGVLLDYDALRQALELVKEKFSGQRIGYPRIGAGLAGGDWDRIALIISECLQGEDHTLVEYVAS